MILVDYASYPLPVERKTYCVTVVQANIVILATALSPDVTAADWMHLLWQRYVLSGSPYREQDNLRALSQASLRATRKLG